MLIQKRHLDRFCDFSRQLLETRDIDPQYYVLKTICDLRKYSKIQRYQFCVTFYGFNHVGSCDKYFRDPSIDPINLPYGRNRRGFRGNRKVLEFLRDAEEVRPCVMAIGESGNSWNQIYEVLLQIRGCGPWSAYCLTEVLNIVLEWNNHAPDFGDVASSERGTGPLACLNLLTGIEISKFQKDKSLHRAVYEETLSNVRWEGMEQMESALCNYLSLEKKLYYVGRDIDRQIPALQGALEDWWKARAANFPKAMLGEINGWTGPRKELMGNFEMGKKWIRS